MVFLNGQRQSIMETNRRGFNFLITSWGYHRYSILHKSMQRLPPSTSLCLSPSLSRHESVCLSLLLSFFRLDSVLLLPLLLFFSFCLFLFCFSSWRMVGGGYSSSCLFSSLLCCHRNKGMEMYVMLFSPLPVSRSRQGATIEGKMKGRRKEKKRQWREHMMDELCLINSGDITPLWGHTRHQTSSKCHLLRTGDFSLGVTV